MFKMKQKFIYLAFFSGLLFLFVNGRDTNQKATENYHNNDYEVHFVVHKTKKAKKEPEIYKAIKSGSLLENINYFPGTNTVDFSNIEKTENTGNQKSEIRCQKDIEKSQTGNHNLISRSYIVILGSEFRTYGS